MKLRTFTVFLWGFLIAAAAVAGETHEAKIKIAIASEGDDHEVFEWNSEDSGVELGDLEVGESKTITNENGKEMTITRTGDGFDIDVDGERIDVMKTHGDVTIEKTRKVKIIKTDAEAGVTIISSDTIDAATRKRIEEVLQDAGKEGEVLFLDGSEEQEFDVTN